MYWTENSPILLNSWLPTNEHLAQSKPQLLRNQTLHQSQIIIRFEPVVLEELLGKAGSLYIYVSRCVRD